MTTLLPPIFTKLPGVISIQRCLAISDGLFYSRKADGAEEPVMVIRHGIRGTQNVAEGKTKKGKAKAGETSAEQRMLFEQSNEPAAVDSTTKEAARDVSNIQITESAKIDADTTRLVVRFGLRYIDLEESIFAVAGAKGQDVAEVRQYRESAENFIARAKSSEGLRHVAERMARNIVNGRWLWRNRTMANGITIAVSDNDKNLLGFADALTVPLNNFDNVSDLEQKIAERIVSGLQGETDCAMVVTADVDLGILGGVEVFPSQNYLDSKPKGFARPLYFVSPVDPARTDRLIHLDTVRPMGHAALRDQKLSNALRTIDTWYPSFSHHQRPIPVEPMGANLDAQDFFRDKKTSAFEYARRFNELEPNSPEGQFMIAILIRGGVLSGQKDGEA
ncbi:type I-F CRISPR-associated protein Csy3 [Thiorhodovibrio frisius]|uniref:CRISPR type I-F/YPEST-associated protein Csy3 n=1 Tax=Thiorhodovibrio frisius TaxID=631362 RepID=H8Z7X4_9GAMM|nr:type I-F CRISPR-associated protein Csy3 [Thiorhodovibrio frisius]EIC20986.1 CRISPR type I-F/YPEST-associated protein Csy3 [Thiorhodovibrio frisius]WPL22042.1 CRISPR-associated protein Csy3 [Thiorhodovibrio frisius]